MAEAEMAYPDGDFTHLSALAREPLLLEDERQFDVGYEQIRIAQTKIACLKDRLKAGKMKTSKKLKAETQLAQLQSDLARLQYSHDEGAKVLRRKALALAALPREMRDAIFEQIYLHKESVKVSVSRHGDHIIFNMPKDTALYMSALHVGEDLAREAAEVFYKQNVFSFIRGSFYRAYGYDTGFSVWDQAQVDQWFSFDHYGSGICPKDCIRHLSLHFDRISHRYDGALMTDWQSAHGDRVCNHIYFEKICMDVDANSWHDYRGRLRSFLQYTTLKSIEVTIANLTGRLDTMARILNPLVREFRDAGIKFTFVQPALHDADQRVKLSHIFDDPSDEDYAEYYNITQRPTVFNDDPHRDVFDTWAVIEAGGHGEINVHMPFSDNLGAMRVWLYEHYEMSKFVSRDYKTYKALGEMVQEFRHLSPKAQQLRQMFYPKMLEYLRT